MQLKALYLGDNNDGVKVHSLFLSKCDVTITFDMFKTYSVDKDKAPFFIDLYDEEQSLIVDTVGISEETYTQITGEVVMSYEYYEREADYNQDLIFGAMEKVIRQHGIDVPWDTDNSFGLAALDLQSFKKTDRIIHELNVDSLILN